MRRAVVLAAALATLVGPAAHARPPDPPLYVVVMKTLFFAPESKPRDPAGDVARAAGARIEVRLHGALYGFAARLTDRQVGLVEEHRYVYAVRPDGERWVVRAHGAAQVSGLPVEFAFTAPGRRFYAVAHLTARDLAALAGSSLTVYVDPADWIAMWGFPTANQDVWAYALEAQARCGFPLSSVHVFWADFRVWLTAEQAACVGARDGPALFDPFY